MLPIRNMSLGALESGNSNNFSPLFVHSIHILHSHAKYEQVPLSRLLCHLHIGSVHGANGQSAVKHELHVSCA